MDMSTQGNYREKIGTGIKEGKGESRTEGQGGAKDKAKFKKQIASLRAYGSEFKKLENYILGSSAAIITNVSLIVGLGSAGAGKGPIIGGLLTFALADNISDSLGIHWYKQSEGRGKKLSSLATALNFLSRLPVSFSFIAIVLIFRISQAIIVGIVWALLLLILISYLMTRRNHESSILGIIKHVLIAVVVIVLSRCVGYLIADYF
jgi:MFS family permease